MQSCITLKKYYRNLRVIEDANYIRITATREVNSKNINGRYKDSFLKWIPKTNKQNFIQSNIDKQWGKNKYNGCQELGIFLVNFISGNSEQAKVGLIHFLYIRNTWIMMIIVASSYWGCTMCQEPF